jgi:hypothetical protein
MANTSRINGFTIVGSAHGSPASSRIDLYYVASAADEILVGDVVKLAATADAIGIPGADLCSATDVPCGIVVGIVNSKLIPDSKMTTGAITLDSPTSQQIAALSTGYILVNTDPDVIMEVEAANGTPAIADIGLNASHTNGTRTSATVVSPAYIDMATEAASSTLNFNLRGFKQAPNNEVGASARLIVAFNRHQFRSVGTTGI